MNKPAPIENNFDLIRLYAATQVALLHAALHLETGSLEWMNIAPGVPIFFFISGFLIYQSYVNSRTLANYALNRALRIYPALISCFVISLALAIAVGYLPISRLVAVDAAVWTAAQLTVAQFFNAEFMRGYGTGVLNGSLWTISVELQFYVLTPILFYLTRGKPWAWAVIATIFVVPNVLWASAPQTTTLEKLRFVTFATWFYMFVLGAWASQQPWIIPLVRRIPLIAVVALFAAAVAASSAIGLPTHGLGMNPLSYVALCLLILKLAYTAPTLSSRLLGRNDISYGIYIYHLPIINAMMHLGYLHKGVHLAVAIGLTYLCAIASWFLVERPMLALKKQALRRYVDAPRMDAEPANHPTVERI